MGQLKNFLIEAEEAGANVELAVNNFSEGMLWDQASPTCPPRRSRRWRNGWRRVPSKKRPAKTDHNTNQRSHDDNNTRRRSTATPSGRAPFR